MRREKQTKCRSRLRWEIEAYGLSKRLQDKNQQSTVFLKSIIKRVETKCQFIFIIF
jgi:hypothetical protein